MGKYLQVGVLWLVALLLFVFLPKLRSDEDDGRIWRREINNDTLILHLELPVPNVGCLDSVGNRLRLSA